MKGRKLIGATMAVALVIIGALADSQAAANRLPPKGTLSVASQAGHPSHPAATETEKAYALRALCSALIIAVANAPAGQPAPATRDVAELMARKAIMKKFGVPSGEADRTLKTAFAERKAHARPGASAADIACRSLRGQSFRPF
jgi:hypothetical protein